MMMNEVMKEQETELLTSWQCHLRRIIHLEYVENLDLVITASLDCNVRVWTVSGSYIGTFGQVRWRVEDPSTFPMELPADLKRLGVVQTKELDKEEPCSNSCKPHGFCNSWGSCNSCTSSGSCSRQLESKILGQAYKPKVTHLRLPSHLDLPSSSSCHEVTRNSKFLPCSPLLPVPVVSMPDTLKKQQKSQEHSDALSKQKHRKKPCPPKQQPKDNGHA
ncbi:hypothetical protein SKAU_G00000660 [Synaphobranchus kaupii]|uniref:Uncharacterized protein n=1 Tax=Synaphobranchus kaupii TaxID=118154 RepID=A0A9Q1JB76_SYNKA|nr:hypothetical protein SKAU_G00000640 [Synaphobranchus kaupii]KAJ8379288.1 hypothetical protein SKAU_G00000660 [Synaphobranchus kaupii]